MGYIYFFLRVSASETIMTLFFSRKTTTFSRLLAKRFLITIWYSTLQIIFGILLLKSCLFPQALP